MFDPVQLGTFIIGITAMSKDIGVPSKWLPVLAVILGGVLNCGLLKVVSFECAMGGMFVGLVSTGLVSATSNIAKKISPLIAEESKVK